MTRPLVSVVIPAYNHEKFIIRCLESVVNQTYSPIELIFIDDGSKDDTFEIADSFLARSMPRSIRLRKNNSGASSTINLGIGLSSGSYINVLNSDDYFDKSRIVTCVDNSLRLGADFVFTGVNFVNDVDNKSEVDNYIMNILHAQNESKFLPSLGFALLKNQIAVSTGNFFFSRRLFNKIGKFDNYLYVHDWDFILRCLVEVEPIYIPKRLYNYRFHGENTFKTLEHLAGYETTEVMRNFLSNVVAAPPANARAPCSYYWPGVFEDYIRRLSYETYLPPRFRRILKPGELIR